MTNEDWTAGSVQPAICAATATIRDALTAIREANPAFLSLDEKASVLTEIPTLIAQLTELNYRVMLCADDVATSRGARNIADLIAHDTQQSHSTTARELRLARDLDTTYPLLQAALRDGNVNLDQTVEITRALNRLPNDLDCEIRTLAEKELITSAAEFTPMELRRLGHRILEVVAPDIADEVEAKRLAEMERDAFQRQQITLRPQGDGTTRISGRLTDSCANRLATALSAFTNPRRDPLHPAPCGCTSTDTACSDVECPGAGPHNGAFAGSGGDVLPAGEAAPASPGDAIRRLTNPHRTAIALNSLLESLDPHRLPIHGGDATTVIVTVTLDALRSELGLATLAVQRESWHNKITAGEARRLACNARILPAVLNGSAQLLDLGRAKRLYTPAQRRALAIQHPYCQAEGCRIPNTWCEAHHEKPWHLGGTTDLANAILLCSRHHHMIHDPHYTAERLPSGGVRFTRRT